MSPETLFNLKIYFSGVIISAVFSLWLKILWLRSGYNIGCIMADSEETVESLTICEILITLIASLTSWTHLLLTIIFDSIDFNNRYKDIKAKNKGPLVKLQNFLDFQIYSPNKNTNEDEDILLRPASDKEYRKLK